MYLRLVEGLNGITGMLRRENGNAVKSSEPRVLVLPPQHITRQRRSTKHAYADLPSQVEVYQVQNEDGWLGWCLLGELLSYQVPTLLGIFAGSAMKEMLETSTLTVIFRMTCQTRVCACEL